MKHLKTFNESIEVYNQSDESELSAETKKIKSFVEAYRQTTLSMDDGDDKWILFSTRSNGDVGSEEAGSEDIKDANNMAAEVKKKFPGVETEVEVVDEWVMLHVNL